MFHVHKLTRLNFNLSNFAVVVEVVLVFATSFVGFFYVSNFAVVVFYLTPSSFVVVVSEASQINQKLGVQSGQDCVDVFHIVGVVAAGVFIVVVVVIIIILFLKQSRSTLNHPNHASVFVSKKLSMSYVIQTAYSGC